MKDIDSILKKIISPGLGEIEPYIRAEYREGDTRLDAMESPYGFQDLPAELRKEWLEIISGAEVNRYPTQLSDDSLVFLQQQFSSSTDQRILLGNGSDEIILLLMLLVGRGAKVLSPDPSFSMYSHISKGLGNKFVGVTLEDDFSLDLGKFEDAIKKNSPDIIFIAQPNNPTGNLFSEDAINLAAELSNGLVVVDRAYDFFYAGDIKENNHPNLIELRTLSKIGTAGLRFGFALGNEELIYQLNKLRLPYNLNILTLRSVEFMLKHLKYFLDWADEIVKERDALAEQMQKLDGVQVFPSATNFLLFKLENKQASACYEDLKRNKVLIKNFDGYHPLLKNCLRISLGKQEDNFLFLEQLKKFVAA